jgi:hypothetical protein
VKFQGPSKANGLKQRITKLDCRIGRINRPPSLGCHLWFRPIDICNLKMFVNGHPGDIFSAVNNIQTGNRE